MQIEVLSSAEYKTRIEYKTPTGKNVKKIISPRVDISPGLEKNVKKIISPSVEYKSPCRKKGEQRVLSRKCKCKSCSIQ